MNANTHTTMALPTRRNQPERTRRTPSRPDSYQAACRPESRWKPACEPGGTCPRPACADQRCRANRPDSETTDRSRPRHDQETESNEPAQETRTGTPQPWSPGANRSRPPITAGPSTATEDGPKQTKRRPSPRPRPRDEWSPGRMQGTVKPSWGEQFATKMRGESGMSTAEYAVGTLAAVAFAGVLLKVLTSGPVQSALSDLIERALA